MNQRRIALAGLLAAGATLGIGVALAVSEGQDPHVVTPAMARRALDSTPGIHITWRRGVVPAGFVGALYGHARRRDGYALNFAFFFTESTEAAGMDTEAVNKYLPEATGNGSAVGQSYIEISDAGAHFPEYGAHAQKEDLMAEELRLRVAAQAPAALREEGP
jgi:hypothetical protein